MPCVSERESESVEGAVRVAKEGPRSALMTVRCGARVKHIYDADVSPICPRNHGEGRQTGMLAGPRVGSSARTVVTEQREHAQSHHGVREVDASKVSIDHRVRERR